MKRFYLFLLTLFIFLAYPDLLFSQSNSNDTSKYKTIIAGEEYKASGWHRWLWGNNYRDVWTTPVSVKILYLDTAKGGLKPVKTGGGNQTRTLHFVNANGEEYSTRSVNKTLGKVLPKSFANTFIEDKVNDEVSMANPYGASAIPYLAAHAKIYHTNPEYVYLHKQPALENFNDSFGNNLYLFEQRINGGLKNADNLGNFDSTLDTFEMLDSLQSNNRFKVDQTTFIRSRLFDMFINDWDRHEGQWRWGQRKDGYEIIFIPIPQDRDQVFFKHDGLLLNAALGGAGLKYMQSFDDNLKDVKTFNYEEKNLDRRLLNETTLDEWQSAAKDLQQSLTDAVIETAVHNLPKEIYPEIGNDIIRKLKARRAHLFEWATGYYNFISAEVEVPGSNKDDEFVVKGNNDETVVDIYKLNSNRIKYGKAFYSRVFKPSETKEIRLFGLQGTNKYVIENAGNIKLKVITGSGNDSVIDIASNKNSRAIVYSKDAVQTNASNIHVIHDTTFRSYDYSWYKYDKNGFLPTLFYSNEDRLYASLGYRMKHYAWGKNPFASDQLLDYHYSLMEKSYSVTYKALFPNVVAHADLSILSNYDNIRWKYFFGFGNESVFSDAQNKKYYTMRTRQWIIQPGLVRNFGNNSVNVFAVVKGLKIINDTSGFTSKEFKPAKSNYDWKTFAGAGISYSFQYLNDIVVPTKGIYFNAIATGASNIKNSSSHYFDYAGTAHFYIPLISKFSLNIRTGAETITGDPEFYQYPSIGGPKLRGVVRDRFWGKTAFYNTNDLRFISPVHTHIFNGKAGLLAFFDNGRVWMPGEKSNTWHTAFGGGIILAPFNALYVDATYGVSANKESSVQVRITTYLKEKK